MKKTSNFKLPLRYSLPAIFLLTGLNLSLLLYYDSLNLSFFKIWFITNIIIDFLLTYYSFNKGMHPVFIFIGTLTLFQGGLIISSLLSKDFSLRYVGLMGANFYLPEDITKKTILLIILSALFIMLGSTLSYKKISLESEKTYDNITAYTFLIIFFLTLPFYLYKQYIYVNFVLNNGGYMALYTSHEFLNKAGFLVRAVSFFAPISFLAYFFTEKNIKRLKIITLFFFIITVSNLIMGVRGLFFAFWLTYLFFYKIKVKSNFSIKSIVFLFLAISIVALVIGYARTNTKLVINANPILMFLGQQGVSFQVSAMAIEFHNIFSKFALNYILYGCMAILDPRLASSINNFFANGLGAYLNYSAYSAGFGTASSYIAESYLLGRIIGVVGISFIIGILLSFSLSFSFRNWFVGIISFTVIEYLIYLPRDFLTDTIAQLSKVLPYLIVIFIVELVIKSILKTFLINSNKHKIKGIKNENIVAFK